MRTELTSWIAYQAVRIAPSEDSTPFSVGGAEGTLQRFFTEALWVLGYVAGIAALAYIIWAGIRYITAASDTKKATEARSALLAVVIGIVIISSAYFIIQVARWLGDSIAGSI